MATKGNSGLSDTKGKETRQCKICRITFPDIYKYTTHLESKDHVKEIMKQKYGEKYLEAKRKLKEKFSSSDEEPQITQQIEKSKTSSSEDNDEDSDVYTCKECMKVCTGLLSYRLHLEGSKHKKMIKKLKLIKEMKQQELIQDPDEEQNEKSFLGTILTKTQLASNDIECKICKKKCCGPESFKNHCKSIAHQKKKAMQNALQELESDGKGLQLESDETFYAHCKICDKGFSGPLPYLQHMESISHLKQERQMKQLTQIKDLFVSSKEDSNIECKECGKLFSGPIPFHTHLKSSAHTKLKKKNSLLVDLEKAHPEMVKKNSTDRVFANGESEEEFLGCEVCNIVFSGPEAARDHFNSAKHKKAVAKKAQFQKFKKLQKGEIKAFPKTSADNGKCDEDSEFEKEFDILPDL